MNANDSSAGPPQQAAIDPRTGEWLFGDRRAQAIDATQAIDRLGALCALGQAVYSSVGLDELFEAVVRFLDRLLEPEHCFVGVFARVTNSSACAPRASTSRDRWPNGR
ncbi:MAG TPA: hypothetical protein EYP56_01530 [Planctomycetaceae bacterium]|nr:hypothetical protein [Planctomycetaceae bacterium]